MRARTVIKLRVFRYSRVKKSSNLPLRPSLEYFTVEGGHIAREQTLLEGGEERDTPLLLAVHGVLHCPRVSVVNPRRP